MKKFRGQPKPWKERINAVMTGWVNSADKLYWQSVLLTQGLTNSETSFVKIIEPLHV